MDPGSGHIYEMDKIDIKNIKGKLVPWQVGEEVIIKDCKFTVKQIRTFPEDEIVLKGIPNEVFEQMRDLGDKIHEKSQHPIMDFVRNKKK